MTFKLQKERETLCSLMREQGLSNKTRTLLIHEIEEQDKAIIKGIIKVLTHWEKLMHEEQPNPFFVEMWRRIKNQISEVLK